MRVEKKVILFPQGDMKSPKETTRVGRWASSTGMIETKDNNTLDHIKKERTSKCEWKSLERSYTFH